VLTCFVFKLRKAYDTLKDENSRRAYDLLYPAIEATHEGVPPPPKDSDINSISEDEKDVAALDAVTVSKQNLILKWRETQEGYDGTKNELYSEVLQLQNEIRELDTKIRSAAYTEACAVAISWCLWILSFFYPISVESLETKEDKEQRDRVRLELSHLKNFKMKKLETKNSKLMEYEAEMDEKRNEFDEAIEKEDNIAFTIRKRMWVRLEAKQKEEERMEREKWEEYWRVQELEQAQMEREQTEELQRVLVLQEKLDKDEAKMKVEARAWIQHLESPVTEQVTQMLEKKPQKATRARRVRGRP
jgi:hypothetical protein